MLLASSTNDKRPRMTATKDRSKRPTFLVLSGSYGNLFAGIYCGDTVRATYQIDAIRASAHLTTTLEKELLEKAEVSLRDLDFIAIDAGPGAFTSLRVLLAFVNGLALALGIPVISCDGLRALSAAAHSQPSVALLNAYNSEVYYHFMPGDYRGYAPIDEVVAMMKSSSAPTSLLGDGVAVYEQQLCDAGIDLTVWQREARFADGAVLAQEALTQWLDLAYELQSGAQPLYLKQPRYKKAS